MFSILDEGVLSHNPGTRAFIPSVTPLNDGTFIAAQQVGSELGSRDHHIEILRSENGRDWTNQGRLDMRDGERPWSYHSAQVYEVPDGRLLLRASRFWHRDDPRQFEKPDPGMPRTGPVILWTRDQARTWSEPRFVDIPLRFDEYTHHVMGNLIRISDDRWMFPIQLNNPKHHYNGPSHHGAALLSTADQGKSFGEFTVLAQDPDGIIEYHDQFGILLEDGSLYTMLWTIDTRANADLNNHWVISRDGGKTWSNPEPTNLRGQVCAPIRLSDGRIAAVYNYRHEPQGIHLALGRDLSTFDTENEIAIYLAGRESMVGKPKDEHFLSRNEKIAFGRPNGVQLPDGTILIWFWCTTDGVTHTRWARVQLP